MTQVGIIADKEHVKALKEAVGKCGLEARVQVADDNPDFENMLHRQRTLGCNVIVIDSAAVKYEDVNVSDIINFASRHEPGEPSLIFVAAPERVKNDIMCLSLLRSNVRIVALRLFATDPACGRAKAVEGIAGAIKEALANPKATADELYAAWQAIEWPSSKSIKRAGHARAFPDLLLSDQARADAAGGAKMSEAEYFKEMSVQKQGGAAQAGSGPDGDAKAAFQGRQGAPSQHYSYDDPAPAPAACQPAQASPQPAPAEQPTRTPARASAPDLTVRPDSEHGASEPAQERFEPLQASIIDAPAVGADGAEESLEHIAALFSKAFKDPKARAQAMSNPQISEFASSLFELIQPCLIEQGFKPTLPPRIYAKKTVGVCGLPGACGTTRLALAICFHLATSPGARILYTTSDAAELDNIKLALGFGREEDSSYVYKGVTFAACKDVDMTRFDWIVCDFGHAEKMDVDELARFNESEMRLCTMPGTPWKAAQALAWIISGAMPKATHLCFFGSTPADVSSIMSELAATGFELKRFEIPFWADILDQASTPPRQYKSLFPLPQHQKAPAADANAE